MSEIYCWQNLQSSLTDLYHFASRTIVELQDHVFVHTNSS